MYVLVKRCLNFEACVFTVCEHLNPAKILVLDRMRRAYEDILNDWAGWGALIWLAAGVLLTRLSSFFRSRETTTTMIRAARVTKFVNAAAVGGTKNELQNQAIMVEL